MSAPESHGAHLPSETGQRHHRDMLERAVVESATISEARAGMLMFVVTTRAFRPTKPSTTDAGSALNSLEELPESNAC
jgi:hypothetical protein